MATTCRISCNASTICSLCFGEKHVGQSHGLLAQRIQRRLCLPFGEEADDGVQDDDDQDGHRFDAFSQRQGHAAGRKKQQHDEAAELVQEDRKAGARLDRRQSVGTVLRVPPRRLGPGQAVRRAGSKALRRLFDRECVPGYQHGHPDRAAAQPGLMQLSDGR
jgi:hypothetical protein